MELVLTDEFIGDYRRVKDGAMQSHIKKALEAVLENPWKGKDLRYELKGKKSVRCGPFRIIYEISGDDINVLKIGHRKGVYG